MTSEDAWEILMVVSLLGAAAGMVALWVML